MQSKNLLKIISAKKKTSAHWFNSEIKNLMKKRRTLKSNQMQYHQLNQEIKTERYKAKEKWLGKECQKLEKHQFDAKEMFKKIKEIAEHKSATASKCIKAKNGNILHDPKDVAKKWEEYEGTFL